MSAPLRFGIMTNGPQLAAWQLESIRLLMESGLAQPVLLIVNVQENTASGFGKKIRSYPYKNFLYRAWKRFFLRVPAQEYQPLPAFLTSLPEIKCRVIRKGKYSEYFSPGDIAAIRSHQPDFILRYGFNIIRGEIHSVPKYGVWSFHHGDERTFRGGPTGFWEIYRNSPVNGVILQRLNDKIDAGVVLTRRDYQSVLHSYAEHLEKILRHNADMPLEVCKKIVTGNTAGLEQPHSATTAKMNKVPQNFRMLIFLLKLVRNRIRFHYMRLFRQEKWDIACAPLMPELPDGDWKKDLRWLQLNGKGWYGADPFVFSDSGKRFLVYERYGYRERKGKINLLQLDETFKPVAEKTVLESVHHLAYPFIFRHGEAIYMIPETAEEGAIKLYRWNGETETFDLQTQLLAVAGVDASILFYENRWWLFCGIRGDLPNEKLHIFYADALEGPYYPHLLNPVKTSPEGSRMGGNFIRRGNEIYRPGQYSRKWYGEKIAWWKIVKLTPEVFEEEPVGEWAPDRSWTFSDGLHTVSTAGDFFAIDAKKRRSDRVSLTAALRK